MCGWFSYLFLGYLLRKYHTVNILFELGVVHWYINNIAFIRVVLVYTGVYSFTEEEGFNNFSSTENASKGSEPG